MTKLGWTLPLGVALAASLLAPGCSRDGVQTQQKAGPSVTSPAAAAPARPTRPEGSTGSAPGLNIGATIPAFTAEAIDVTGQSDVTTTFDSQKTTKVTVYAFLGTHCPTTQMYLDRLRELEATYRPKGVDFVYIYPNRTDPSDQKRLYHRSQKFAGPMIDDEGAKIAVGTLSAQRTSEILVIDASRVVRYRGAIDDNKDPEHVTRRHLALALDEILAGKPVTQAKTNVFA